MMHKTPTLEKFIYDLTLQLDNTVNFWCKTVRILAVSYGWTVLNRTKLKCIFVHPVVNLKRGSYKKHHSWTRFHGSRKPKCVLNPCCEKLSTLAFRLDSFPRFRWQTGVLVTLQWGSKI